MSFALAGLIILQAYWINHDVELKQKQFDQSVKETLIDVIDKVVDECLDVRNEEQPSADAMIMFSCKARHLSLGPMVSDEIDKVKEVWGSPLVGFFSYGEMGKATKGKHEFHNNTCSLVVLKEK